MRVKRKFRILLASVLLLLFMIIVVFVIDTVRYKMYINNYNENYQLLINEQVIEPSLVEGKNFLFHELDGKSREVKVPKDSVLNLGDDYVVYDSNKNKLKEELTYLKDGEYTLEINDGEYKYIYYLKVDNDFSVEIDDTYSYAAGYLAVEIHDVNSNEEVTISPEFKTSDTFNYNESVILVPIDYDTKPSDYKVKFSSNFSSNEEVVKVKDYEFRESHFEVDNSVIDEASQEPDGKELEAYNTANSLITAEKYYLEDDFKAASVGSTTGDFGDVRYINGDTVPTKIHYGIDYANVLNTDIYSTNKGKVAFVGFMPRYGNMIVVDHGNGITSHYYHLETVYVKEGDMVDSSSVIAGMGTTGYSTGVHLHFEIHINGVIVNPYFILNTRG